MYAAHAALIHRPREPGLATSGHFVSVVGESPRVQQGTKRYLLFDDADVRGVTERDALGSGAGQAGCCLLVYVLQSDGTAGPSLAGGERCGWPSLLLSLSAGVRVAGPV